MPIPPALDSAGESSPVARAGTPAGRWSSLRPSVAAFFTFYIPLLFLAVALQVRTGVYGTEFGHDPDEPAHVVSSLMVHDYVTSGIPRNPLRYAETYYLHYPKVAIGMWPPVFYTLAAAWISVFPATHDSMMAFMAVQCALLASVIALFLRRRFGWVLSFCAAAVFVSFYLIQYGASLFMLDILLALAEFIAILLLIRFFKTERTWDAAWFGLATAAAMLTKGNAIALILVPPVMIVVLRRWSILKRPGLYVSAAVVLLIGGPWQMITIRLLSGVVPIRAVTLPYVANLIAGYLPLIVESTGYLILAIATLGLSVELWRAMRRVGGYDARAIEMTGIAALGLAVYLFHCVSPYPGPESRYMTPVLAVVPVFLAAGWSWIAGWVPARAGVREWVAPAVAVAVIVVYATTTFASPKRPPLGYTAASAALSWPEARDGVVLISADGFGEGALVSEIALHDHRPNRFVLRGSKVLSEGRWSLAVHTPILKTAEEVQKYLVSIPVDAVVVDRTAPLWQAETDLLLKTMNANPQTWKLEAEVPAKDSQRNILVYRYTGPRDPAAKRDIRVRMRYLLGRDLKM